MANELEIGVTRLTNGEVVNEDGKGFGSALAERQPEVKHVNAAGNYVEATDPTVAFSVNMADPDAHNFIEGIKAKQNEVKPKEGPVVVSRIPSDPEPAKETKKPAK